MLKNGKTITFTVGEMELLDDEFGGTGQFRLEKKMSIRANLVFSDVRLVRCNFGLTFDRGNLWLDHVEL